MRIHFVDTETTGLDLYRHLPWEVADVVFDTESREIVSQAIWQLPITDLELAAAEPIALEISRWADRRFADLNNITSYHQFGQEFLAGFEKGDHWAGACPWFDEARLSKILLERCALEGGMAAPFVAPWHYHLICVENMMLGYLGGTYTAMTEWAEGYDGSDGPLVPWRHGDLVEKMGLMPIEDDRKHTALGDALSAVEAYKFMTLEV